MTQFANFTEKEKRRLFERVSASGLPIYTSDNPDDPTERLIFDRVDRTLPKVLVTTIPRSGTHFTTELLTNLGMIFAGLHVAPSLEHNVVDDRRFRKMNAAGDLFYPRYLLQLDDVFRLIGAGQFIQGHVPYRADFADALSDAKIIYVQRNLKNVAVSALRFISKLASSGHTFEGFDTDWTGLDEGPLKMYAYLLSFGSGLPDMVRAIQPWQNAGNCHVLNFDELTSGDNVKSLKAVEDLAKFLGIKKSPHSLSVALQRTVGASTVTWTGELSQWEKFWDPDIERLFQTVVMEQFEPSELTASELDDALARYKAARPKPRQATISWLSHGEIESRAIQIDASLPEQDLLSEILSSRIGPLASGQLPTELTPDTWLLEGIERTDTGDWFRLTSTDDHSGHRHLTIPMLNIEPLGMVTFSLQIREGQSNRYFMLQVGNESSLFNSYIDIEDLKVTRIGGHGNSRSVCVRIEDMAEDGIRVSMSGMMGTDTPSYFRVYLCDDRGNLTFSEPVELKIRDVMISKSLEIFSFNKD